MSKVDIHVGYPHEPGTLWECGGCQFMDCQHSDGEGDEWCVSYNHEPACDPKDEC